MDRIAAALATAGSYLRDHPDEARYTDSRASAKVESGLRMRVTGAGGEEISTDMPAGVGGGSSAPGPGWLLRAATASCVASLIVMRAAHLGLDVNGLEVVVDSESDDRGILGLADDVPAGPLNSRIVVRFAAGGPAHDLEDLARWAVEHCPVSDAVKRAVPRNVVVERRS
jgi:uncharacterized OsmC-like protein